MLTNFIINGDINISKNLDNIPRKEDLIIINDSMFKVNCVIFNVDKIAYDVICSPFDKDVY